MIPGLVGWDTHNIIGQPPVLVFSPVTLLTKAQIWRLPLPSRETRPINNTARLVLATCTEVWRIPNFNLSTIIIPS
jgi:hypothetical protein